MKSSYVMNKVIFIFLFLSGFISLSFAQPSKKVIVSYVTSWTKPIPDPKLITHINYAFGHVSDSFNAVRIDNPERLKEIVKLRNSYKKLKILLSIGGWGSGRFSEMAANPDFRRSFAKDCQRVVKEFKLDGIDIDWEYPTSSAAGISSNPEDTKNFSLLIKEIRQHIGKNKLLTLASIADAKYMDFKTITPFLDFVNVMMYDVAKPPKHHASLYRSALSGPVTLVESIEAHILAGIPKEKLVMGIPFYGRGDKSNVPDFILFKDYAGLNKYTLLWDDIAQVPYAVNDEGIMLCTFENEKSLRLKADYIRSNNLLGAMYWEFVADDADLTLSKALFEELNK
ncbi:glycoside hydrolase family 18 protein [Sphingobacterium sp. HJSM2_6]|uniref:glycoside hydrolase family 18 protein n=1 Tax=Sphingobacterium sp. HJSM2_6 TaxID=3366264 RepID=UPI003BF5C7FC